MVLDEVVFSITKERESEKYVLVDVSILDDQGEDVPRDYIRPACHFHFLTVEQLDDNLSVFYSVQTNPLLKSPRKEKGVDFLLKSYLL